MLQYCDTKNENIFGRQLNASFSGWETQFRSHHGDFFSTHCMLGNFACIFIVWWFFFKINFFGKFFQKYQQCQTVWIQIRPDRMPYLCPNCLHRLSADNISKQRVNHLKDLLSIFHLHCRNRIVLFDLILYVPSTIFQLNRDGSSWVEPVLS